MPSAPSSRTHMNATDDSCGVYDGSSDSPDVSGLSDTPSGIAAIRRMGAVSMLAAAAWALIGAHKPDQGIAYQLSSRGNVVAQWSIEPNGQIVLEQAARGARPFGPLAAVTIQPSPERYRWIVRILAPTRKWAGKSIPCQLIVTDAPYGTLQWSQSPPIRFNGGCAPTTPAGCYRRRQCSHE
jgi:hypothetical protein